MTALLLLALHRLNQTIHAGRCGHRATGARTGSASVGILGPRPRPGPVVEADFREYASSAPRVERGKTTVRTSTGATGSGRGRRWPAVEIVNTTPHREPNAGSDLLVPLGQAVITAGIAALVVGVLGAIAGRGDVLRLVGVAFVGVLAVAWLWRLGVVDSLLSVVERITQEIDGDEEEAEDPAHAMLENPNQARQTAGRIAEQHAGAIKTAELLSFLTRCAVVGTSEGKLGIGTSPQARAHYAALRDALIDLGIGAWRDPNRRAAGWLLTMTPEQAAPIISRHVKELRAG